MTFYCWWCYAPNTVARGPCGACGKDIAGPAGATYVDMLLWALRHPVVERRMMAARILGQRREPRAREALETLATQEEDPYLAAEALRALFTIDGMEAHRDLAERLARHGAPAVRVVALEASEHRPRARDA